jgi:hypothetical protein
MTKADSVHSTPRITASKIVSFPKSKRPLPADRPLAIALVESSGLRLVAGKSKSRSRKNLSRMNRL